MTAKPDEESRARDQRLAAALKANLRRRKVAGRPPEPRQADNAPVSPDA